MLSSTPLEGTRHTLSGFDSGEPRLDGWLVTSALVSDARGITRTFVGTEVDTTTVIGYYSLMAHVLQRGALPKSLGHGSPVDLPAVLLARLALDTKTHSQGLGGALLAAALERGRWPRVTSALDSSSSMPCTRRHARSSCTTASNRYQAPCVWY